MNIGRNEKCPCGSDKKFKKCHMNTEQGKQLQKNYGNDFIEFLINKIKKT
jgi:hypothetical protein